jgi:hypothetical protein
LLLGHKGQIIKELGRVAQGPLCILAFCRFSARSGRYN